MVFQTIWGWQPALYLFLGGLGSGAFIISALINLISKAHRRAVEISMFASIGCLVVGLLLLLADVEKPLVAMMMWQSFSSLQSWMAIGAWLLFAAVVAFLVTAVSVSDFLSAKLKMGEALRSNLASVFSVIGIVLGFGVALYTGILLMNAPGVPFWDTPLIPVLFTASALDAGAALVAIIVMVVDRQAHDVQRRLEITTIVLVAVEAVLLIALLTLMLAGGDPQFARLFPGFGEAAVASAESLLSGQLSVGFWVLLVVVGLLVPFVCACFLAFGKKDDGKAGYRRLAVVSAACVLIGGCSLRFLVLFAGSHADFVSAAIATML